jgi:hypothetical protein
MIVTWLHIEIIIFAREKNKQFWNMVCTTTASARRIGDGAKMALFKHYFNLGDNGF